MIGIYSLYADVLDYPTPHVFSQLRELSRRIAANNSDDAPLIQQFEAALNGMSLSQVQEIYTSSFDMHPDCTPNLGCHLFGEDVRRNIFMARLKERMDHAQVPTGAELPDHLSLILRLLDLTHNEDESHALVEDCLVPGVTRILSALEQMNGACPYIPAFQALLVKLKNTTTAAGVGADLGTNPTESG
jgi:nitrate reductase molybdenum cofactor assembly chaperone NarJ/NarW